MNMERLWIFLSNKSTIIDIGIMLILIAMWLYFTFINDLFVVRYIISFCMGVFIARMYIRLTKLYNGD